MLPIFLSNPPCSPPSPSSSPSPSPIQTAPLPATRIRRAQRQWPHALPRLRQYPQPTKIRPLTLDSRALHPSRSEQRHDDAPPNGYRPQPPRLKRLYPTCRRRHERRPRHRPRPPIGRRQADQITKAGTQAIHEAALSDSPTIIRELVSNGADPNARTRDEQQTPLHLAAALGRLKALETLLALKADSKLKDASGLTPLQAAQRAGLTDAVALLKR